MKHFLFAVLMFLVLLTAATMFVNIPYNIRTKGIVQPVREWGLYKTFDGTLVNTLKDHRQGIINEYKVLEFQRGDIVSFRFNEQLLENEFVNQGDTIVWIVSSDLKMNILEKQGALAYEESLLQIYLAGDKPEALRLALQQVELAHQELQTQQKVTERIEHLRREELVSQQEYELAINELKVKEHQLGIAESHYESIMSGEKEEEIRAIRARIASLEQQMRHLEEHMAGMNILSPIAGKLIRERSLADSVEERLFTVADISGLLIVAPVDLFEAGFIEKGQEVTVSSSHSRSEFKGQIINIDNSVQIINRQPKLFISILLSSDDARAELHPSLIIDAQIHSPEVSVFEYLVRKSRIVYQN
jgi:multidrug efflux pump subunit AcrA (membrane-fusion protein)